MTRSERGSPRIALVLRHFGSGLLWGAGGYVLGVATCWVLVALLSPNRHDRSTEAVMTAFFVGGPFVAVVAFVFGVVRSVRGAP